MQPTGIVAKAATRMLAVSLAALLCACALHVRQTDGRWRLNHPFDDYYDTAFVFSDAGKSMPRTMTVSRLADVLSGYDVVFYGESHGHPGVHLQEMKLLRELYRSDQRWILSLEQFERDVQSVLDDYLAGRVGEMGLIDRGRAWSNYAASYRPLLVFAKAHRLPVIAAEAPGWAVACVGQSGVGILDQFTPLERSWVADTVHAGPGAYRDDYMKFLGGSMLHATGNAAAPEAAQHAERDAQNSFAAQATRDDTMAESIAGALQRHPGYKVLHVTGSFHSHGFLGTVERLRMRNPDLKIAVIDPVEVEDPNAPAVQRDELAQATVVQLIYPNPEDFVTGEDTSAWAAKMHAKHGGGNCKYTLPAAVR